MKKTLIIAAISTLSFGAVANTDFKVIEWAQVFLV
jgi:hypothetical protein